MTGPTPEEMQAAFERALGTMDEFAAGQASVQKAFLGGPEPPPPHEAPGEDPTDDALACRRF